ncbi:fungal-specific transcription factor domain-containing protein [Mycena maculata]|uniref:Fungal-specific transcription factor domain-containing protein n=1 Tax=Mycena maculata TaxID=230809 RepID=A0AAD7JGS6_9AGAR|nr:fungal-specific transcription factor domain-containing protein [Mycena maculata]
MPKGASHPRARKPYATQACTVCRTKKSKCDGVKPVCGSCVSSGRDDECLWGRDIAARKPRTEAHFEALRKRADSLQAYSELLEGTLAKCVCQDVSAHFEFRPQQSEELDCADGASSSSEFIDSDEEITQELTVPAQRLKLDNNLGGLLLHGITSPFRFINRLPHEVSPITDVAENSDASYILLVDGVDISDADPDIDWSRYLPPEVVLDRREHDKILDLAFKFFTMWCLRIVPSLFLRDMHRALSVPRSQPTPRTPHYSPMLHNAFLSLCSVLSDDLHMRDTKTREYFANAAKACIQDECQRPDISLVHALAFLGTYHSNNGDRIMGELYFGMCSRISISLGLGVDPTVWVKSGLLSHEQMVSRNYAHWTIFCMDVCWASYFGRESYGPPLDRPKIPLPFVDSESDQIPWYYPPANIPPQPNFTSLAFYESASLFVIAHKIIDVVNGLRLSGCPRDELIKVDAYVTKIDLELNNWKSRIPPQLDITQGNKVKSTPQRLMLHFEYWWCSILLHRPFFNRRPRHGHPDVNHVKLCKRAAESILELAETWSSLYTLRYSPVTMLQVLFSAGTVFILLALQATASLRIAHGSLKTALAQAERCVRYLHEVGQTWSSSTRTADILSSMLNDKLRPIIARRLSPKRLEDLTPAHTPEPPGTETGASSLESSPAQSFTGLPYTHSSFPPYAAPYTELGAEWAQMPMDYFPQHHGNVQGGFGQYPVPLYPTVGGNTLPEWDSSEFLSTIDWIEPPKLWEHQNLAGIDRSRHF